MSFATQKDPGTAAGNEYFFVVGYPRSGTTLVSVLLDRHSRLCVTPETAFFDEVAPLLTSSKDSVLMRVLGEWRLPELNLEPEMVRQRLGKKGWSVGDVFASILDLYTLRKAKARCGEKTRFVVFFHKRKLSASCVTDAMLCFR